MKVLNRFEWTGLCVILIYSFIPTFGGLVRIFELASGIAIAPPNPRALDSPFPIVLHILSSFVFCLLGALQFIPSIRRTYPAKHRALGRIVFVAGGLSAASGLWMTHIYAFPSALQGNLLYWVRIVIGTSMIAFLLWAIVAIRVRNFFLHRAFMLRAYAIAQGASTQTILGISWLALVGSEAVGPVRDGIMVGAWALNIIIIEMVIWRLGDQMPSSRLRVRASAQSLFYEKSVSNQISRRLE